MEQNRTNLLITLGLLLFFLTGLLQAQETEPLKTYVYQDDPAYSYQLLGQLPGDDFDAYFINMNSQQWRTPEEVTPNLWNHWMTVIVPHQLTSNTANLIVYSGKTSTTPPDPADVAMFVPLATLTGSVQVILQQVPAQPLQFAELDQPTTEDTLVSYTWRKSMQTGDPTWSAYFPMTKAAVRAMDTVQSFTSGTLGYETDSFIVTGFSKRGAIAWLTAAIDPRVSAVVPSEFNILHIADQLEHHYNSYGFYSEALAGYENNGITSNIRSPEGKILQQLMDPISYKDALTMPHLLINVTGDEFFLPDASEAYIHEIPAETLQRIIPNTNHGFDGKLEDMLMGLIAWYQVQLYGIEKPQIEWHLEDNGELIVSSSTTPAIVKLWQATNPTARDFRHPIVGDTAWGETLLTADTDGKYRVSVPSPGEGYTAYMVELTYPGMTGIPQIYTTSVYVTPDEKPFEVEDLLDDPKAPRYWRRQVNQAIAGKPLEHDLSSLQAMLPIRVLGEYINDVDGLAENLNSRGAKRNCTAARLNVEADELGWYTTLFTIGQENIKYWQPYDLAETAYERGRPRISAEICHYLTRQ
jgi:PhoPQ-activated pathogenicity-related protein